jgi:hypothetical protein
MKWGKISIDRLFGKDCTLRVEKFTFFFLASFQMLSVLACQALAVLSRRSGSNCPCFGRQLVVLISAGELSFFVTTAV